MTRTCSDFRAPDVRCDYCGIDPSRRTCHRCGATALIVDCGHRAQPRPIAAGLPPGGHDLHLDYCEDCVAELSGVRS